MFIFRPVARSTIATDTIMLLFGGRLGAGSTTSLTTIQTFDGSIRRIFNLALSSATSESCAGLIGQDSFIFGGNYSTVHKVTGMTSAATSATYPSTSVGRSSCTSNGSAIWLFGGYDASNLARNFIFIFNGSVATLQAAALSVGSSKSTSSLLSGVAYIFGASNNTAIETFNGTTRASALIGLAASQEYGSSTALSSLIWIFGGDSYSNQIKTYNGITYSTLGVVLSFGNLLSTALTFSSDPFLFGGTDGSTAFNTIQRWTAGVASSNGATLSTANFAMCGTSPTALQSTSLT